jgi:hypothetical protein
MQTGASRVSQRVVRTSPHSRGVRCVGADQDAGDIEQRRLFSSHADTSCKALCAVDCEFYECGECTAPRLTVLRASASRIQVPDVQ